MMNERTLNIGVVWVLLWTFFPADAFAVELVDSFDDGSTEDNSPVSWSPPAMSTSGDLVLRGITTSILATSPQLSAVDSGWSIQAQARLTEGNFFGLMADAGSTPSGFSNGWSMLDPNGTVYIGSVFSTLGQVGTNLRPREEEVMLQLDSFGDLFQVWAWRRGEPRPVEPLLERQVQMGGGSLPTLWTRNPSGGPTEARFRWVQFSSDRSIPDIPAPAGDFNNDALFTSADIDLLTAEIWAGSNDVSFDLTEDALVDDTDLTKWLSDAAEYNGFSQPYPNGDSNLDGAVDSSDLNNLGLSWRQNVSEWSRGDFTGDGVVDSADLNVVGLSWRSSIPFGSAVNAPVPEPSAFWLTMIGLSLIGRRKRRLLASFHHLCRS